VHRLAGAVDATLGVDERVKPGGGEPARNAAVAEIERRPPETQEGVVAVAFGGDQHGGRKRALPAREIGFELHVPVRVGALGRKHFITA
jgi:hypothetical protein